MGVYVYRETEGFIHQVSGRKGPVVEIAGHSARALNSLDYLR
jgi:hypothetical protein